FLSQPAYYVGGQVVASPQLVAQIRAMEEEAQAAGQPMTDVLQITMEEAVRVGAVTVREVLLDRIQLVISIGGQLYWSGYLPIRDYPIVPLNNRHSRNPYPMSDI